MTEIETGTADAAPEAEAVSADAGTMGSIERAFAAAGLDDDAPEAAPETQEDDGAPAPTADDGPARGPDGKFVAKEQAPEGEADAEGAAAKAEADEKAAPKAEPASDAPARFSADAKAEWAKVPAAVKGEVGRALRELEGGLEKYRAAAEPLKAYHEQAERSGTTLHEALERYTSMEGALRQNPLQGLDMICRNLGTTLQDVAAHVTGQTPDAAAKQQDATIAQLRGELASLKQQLGGVSNDFQAQRRSTVEREIAAFAADKPRFDELSETIAQLIGNGMAPDLQRAYEMADRLNPAAAPAPAPAPAAEQQPAPAQTRERKSNLSVNGAPSSGSNPAHRSPAATPQEALERAFSSVGL